MYKIFFTLSTLLRNIAVKCPEKQFREQTIISICKVHKMTQLFGLKRSFP